MKVPFDKMKKNKNKKETDMIKFSSLRAYIIAQL